MNDGLRARLFGGFGALCAVVLLGSVGYWLLGGGRWTLVQCVYMTVITLTTVGYGEVLPGFEEVAFAREYTVLLIVFGMGTFIYFASNLTAVIIEGDLREALRKTRMRKTIQKLEDHVVVCGAGSTGRHVIEELLTTHHIVVAIDSDQDTLEAIEQAHPKGDFLYVIGDATDDETLTAANVAKARGVVAALAGDKDNLYLVVTTRQLNPGARIVARGSDLKVLEKLKRAGADTVVSPNYIGGMRMVSELVRPEVVRFLDLMLRDRKGIRIEEVQVPKGSRYEGKTLAESGIRADVDLSVVAVRVRDGDYIYNPGGDFSIESGMTLVVLGEVEKVVRLRELAA
jgi:voltage-gated potassium channel